MALDDEIADHTDGMMIPSEVVNSFLRAYENEHGFSQRKMASLLGIAPQSYYLLKKGNKVRGDTVRKISEALNVPLSQIVYNEKQDIEKIFQKYPKEIIRWLVTSNGVDAILKAYRAHLEEESKRKIERSMDSLADSFEKIGLK